MEDKTNMDEHNLLVSEREKLNITGMKKIESFDNEEFLLDTLYGPMEIKGNGLEIIKLDTFQGTICIKGIINSITYLNDEQKKENGMFSRLFK